MSDTITTTEAPRERRLQETLAEYEQRIAALERTQARALEWLGKMQYSIDGQTFAQHMAAQSQHDVSGETASE